MAMYTHFIFMVTELYYPKKRKSATKPKAKDIHVTARVPMVVNGKHIHKGRKLLLKYLQTEPNEIITIMIDNRCMAVDPIDFIIPHAGKAFLNQLQ
jgi:hypothetical protein